MTGKQKSLGMQETTIYPHMVMMAQAKEACAGPEETLRPSERPGKELAPFTTPYADIDRTNQRLYARVRGTRRHLWRELNMNKKTDLW
jgi:hypothetical protein